MLYTLLETKLKTDLNLVRKLQAAEVLLIFDYHPINNHLTAIKLRADHFHYHTLKHVKT